MVNLSEITRRVSYLPSLIISTFYRRFFRDGNLEDRLQFLTQEIKGNMDALIQRKLEEERTYIID